MTLTSFWSPSLCSTVLFTTLETVSPSSICTVSWWEPSMVTSCVSMPSADTYLRITFRVIWWAKQEEHNFPIKTVSWLQFSHCKPRNITMIWSAAIFEWILTFLTTMLPCSSVYFSSVTVCGGISGKLSAWKETKHKISVHMLLHRGEQPATWESIPSNVWYKSPQTTPPPNQCNTIVQIILIALVWFVLFFQKKNPENNKINKKQMMFKGSFPPFIQWESSFCAKQVRDMLYSMINLVSQVQQRTKQNKTKQGALNRC